MYQVQEGNNSSASSSLVATKEYILALSVRIEVREMLVDV